MSKSKSSPIKPNRSNKTAKQGKPIQKRRAAEKNRRPDRLSSEDALSFDSAFDVTITELDGMTVNETLKTSPALDKKIAAIAHANGWSFGESIVRLLNKALELNDTIPPSKRRVK